MRTAKYRLSKEESARFQHLACLHALGQIKEPEASELKRLDRERDRRFRRDPRNANYFRSIRNGQRRMNYLLKKLNLSLGDVYVAATDYKPKPFVSSVKKARE